MEKRATRSINVFEVSLPRSLHSRFKFVMTFWTIGSVSSFMKYLNFQACICKCVGVNMHMFQATLYVFPKKISSFTRTNSVVSSFVR